MRSYILINGEPIPQPKRTVTPTLTTIVSEGRNANAQVVGQKIGRTQYKLDSLEWGYLKASEWSKILSLLESFLVEVTFCDPARRKKIKLKMYSGNRTGKPYRIDSNGNPLDYVECKANLIDAGYPLQVIN